MSGWIKLHKKLERWEWYTYPNMLLLWVHLLLNANFKEGSWRGNTIKVGQLVVGRSSLASKLGLSEQIIRTLLSKLQSTSDITIHTTNRYSIITVCKYRDYQFVASNEQPATQPATAPLNNHTIRSKEERSKKEKNIIPTLVEINEYVNKNEKIFPNTDTKKYYMQRQSAGWKKSNGVPVVDWKADIWNCYNDGWIVKPKIQSRDVPYN